jgi:hypothetical protein
MILDLGASAITGAFARICSRVPHARVQREEHGRSAGMGRASGANRMTPQGAGSIPWPSAWKHCAISYIVT